MDENIEETSAEREFLLSKTLAVQINTRSELTQEILSNKPDWLEKNASIIFFIMIFILVCGTWFIKYPDFVTAQFKLTSVNSPKPIISRHQGRLVKLLVKNNTKVKQHEILGYMESTADHSEVLELSQRLTQAIELLAKGNLSEASKFFEVPYDNLGEIQQKYQLFTLSWQTFVDYSKNGFYSQKINELKKDVNYQDSLRKIIIKKQKLAQKDIDLAAESFRAYKYLLEKGVITKAEYRNENSKFLSKQGLALDLEASLLNSLTQKREKQKEIDQLLHEEANQNVIFYQALQSLKSTVDEWMQQYIIQSPTEGIAYLNASIQVNQFLQNGNILGYVNPDKGIEYVEVNLSQSNFGKIDTGLNVQLRLDAFPYQEFGFIEGTLNDVSNVATNKGFKATVRLDNGLKTNNNLMIPYKSGLSGQALIITKNTRLLERIYFKLVKATSIKE